MITQPPQDQGFVYGYARASWDPNDIRNSVGFQVDQAFPEYAKLKGITVKESFADSHVSSRTPLERRPEGGRLLEILMPGDTVIITRLDRMFRSTLEFLSWDKKWAELGVYAYSIYDNMEFGACEKSAIAKLMATIRAAIAEMERDQISERTKEGHARNRVLGKRNSAYAGIGFKWEVRDGKCYRVPYEAERELCRRFLKWYEMDYSLRKIVKHLESHGANVRRYQKREKGTGKLKWVDGEWNHDTVNKAIDLAKCNWLEEEKE